MAIWCVGYVVKDNSDSERGLPFSINYRGYFIYTILHRILHTTPSVTPVAEHWQEQQIAEWVHHEGSIRQPMAL